MAEQEDRDSRTERATPRRQQQARERGELPRSRELTGALLLAGATLGLWGLAGQIYTGLSTLMQDALSLTRTQALDPQRLVRDGFSWILDAVLLIAPFLLLVFVLALAAPLALGGLVFSTQALSLNLSRLDPIAGMKRIFSSQGAVEAIKSFAKFALIALVTVGLLYSRLDEVLLLPRMPLETALAGSMDLAFWMFAALTGVLLVIAGADLPWQIWRHGRNLRMTRQEIREEQKDTEGRPEVRARVRQLQREMAQRRMMEKVPTADVVVTNPTHYAVALAYDQSRMRAPRVVARGADLIALTIRSVAAEHHVPVLEAPPLARALYHNTKLDQEIPQGLYLAVAKVLAYVYQLKAAASGLGDKPLPPEDLPVPEGMDPAEVEE
jgi:flagellar biosynthetic protein FlhB